ncbi:MAG: hypothetical protein LAT77_06800 [Aliidiomarina sp.]|uniref:hypothetical protein n=1 Tax=Aliidiomarina sp. TaxID=1872439 RepID=UPI0025BF3218|nr:hypothetical protein [Aliidiomarina sp.]MCH8501604.1 hypothetical protein [Aliidiomarina sp.]
MTTAIVKTSKFAAIDSRWTDGLDFTVEAKMRKYIYADGELYLFSGSEYPILLEQALLIGDLTEDDYLRFYEELDPNEVFGSLIIDEHSGYLIQKEGHTYDWHHGIAYTGSGGTMAKHLKSSMKTSPSPNGARVSLSEAKARLARRKARFASK